MTSSSCLRGLLATLFVAACDPTESTCDVVVRPFRGLMQNGISVNGTNLNGTNLNGANLNGANLNGGHLDNGTSFQGVSLNGIGLQGADLDGIALEEVELVGTSLRAVDAQGRTIEGADWIGAQLVGRAGDEAVELRIAAVEVDPDDPSLHWYELTHEGRSVCSDGTRGLFVRGVWDETGARQDGLADDATIAFTFSCASGVIAKCVGWGYAPDEVGADVHQSCTRLARADYCGDGRAHTVDGTLVDVYDRMGVMQPEPGSELEFEAGWGPDGATCVSRPRYVERDADGEELEIPCWDALPVCDDADAAFALGAQIVDHSAPQTLCHAQ